MGNGITIKRRAAKKPLPDNEQVMGEDSDEGRIIRQGKGFFVARPLNVMPFLI